MQQILNNIRAVIHETAPEAQEQINYGMPAFHLNGYLIYFAANKNHIGIYPRTAGMEKLDGFSGYKGTKGSVHFPLNKPIPYDLLRRMVLVRMEENQSKASARPKKASARKDDAAA